MTVAETTGGVVLRRALRRQRARVAAGIALLCTHQATEALVPVAIGVVIDRAVATGDVRALLLSLAGLAALFTVLEGTREPGAARPELSGPGSRHLGHPRDQSNAGTSGTFPDRPATTRVRGRPAAFRRRHLGMRERPWHTGRWSVRNGVADDDQVTRWAREAGQGDRQAATAFVRALQDQVWRFLSHLAGPGEADDLTQETFLRAIRNLPGFAGRSSARTWVFTIARRVAVDHVRTAVARPRMASVSDWQAAAEAAGAITAGADEGVTLHQMIAGLTRERREAFVATQVLGLSYAEAADVCQCPVGTIRSRVARAREDLVAAWQADTDPSHERRTG